MTPRQAEIVAAVERYGSIKGAARALGLHHSTVKEHIQRANRDPAVNEAMQAVGTGLVPTGMWIKHPPKEDAPGYSVYLRPQEEAPEDVAERIRAALEGITPAEPVQVPAQVMADLCSVYPIADAHIGMMACSPPPARIVGGRAWSVARLGDRLSSHQSPVGAVMRLSCCSRG